MKIKTNEHEFAIGCDSSCGPTFGIDLCIAKNANTRMNNRSKLGDSYIHPQYAWGTNEADTFLAGSCFFHLDEIEVYEKE